jgi:hypothetical protein
MKRTNFSNQVDRTITDYELNSSVLAKFIGACSANKNDLCIRIGCICMIISSSFIGASCSSDNRTNGEGGGTRQALSIYKGFLDEVNAFNEKETAKLVDLCRRWYALRDSVAASLPHDSIVMHGYPAGQGEFININDSIASRIAMIVRSNDYTLTDYLNFRFALGYIPHEEKYRPYIKPGHDFFANLDFVNPYQGNCRTTIDRYESFLNNTLKKGISTQKELESFICVEDRNFRTSLKFLHNLGDNSLERVNEMTKEIIGSVSLNLIDSCDAFNREKALVLMVMRSNRRLTANAWQCAKDIQEGKLKEEEKLYAAYFWMLLNPFIYIDDIAVCLMSEELKAQYYRLASLMPELMEPISKRLPVGRFSLEELPKELIVAYLTQIR